MLLGIVSFSSCWYRSIINNINVVQLLHGCMILSANLPRWSCPFLYYYTVFTVLFLLCSSGLVAHSDLDERAIEALKEFNEEGALQVLVQFKESDLSHVQVSLIICKTTGSLLKCKTAYCHFKKVI